MSLKAAVVSLGVADIERSIDFYRKHFGFEPADEYRSEGEIVWCCLRSGNGELMLQRLDAEMTRRLQARAGRQTFVIHLRADHIRSIWNSLRSADLKPSTLKQTSYGTEEFLVEDPDGYELWVSAKAEEEKEPDSQPYA